MVDIFKIIGVIGLVLIVIGVLIKKRKKEDLFYIFGGICLAIYSIYIKELIFIILQIVFTLAALYDFIKLKFIKK